MTAPLRQHRRGGASTIRPMVRERHALRCGISIRPMSDSGLGYAKTPAPAAHVETSQRDCAPWSRIVLRARCSIPCWRIVFSTFRNCMSFCTGWVKLGHWRSCPESGHPSAMLYVAEVRKAAVSRCSELFDHLISAGEQRCGTSRPSTLPVLRDFDPDHVRSGLIGLADEHGQSGRRRERRERLRPTGDLEPSSCLLQS